MLKAMGTARAQGFGAVRFSLGRFTTAEQIEMAAQLIAKRVLEFRAGK